jgi:hypothetical protein
MPIKNWLTALAQWLSTFLLMPKSRVQLQLL